MPRQPAVLLTLALLTPGLAACFDQAPRQAAIPPAVKTAARPAVTATPPVAGSVTRPAAGTTVTVVAAGRAAAGVPPRIVLLADGQPAGQADVTADHAQGEWGRYRFTLPGPQPGSLGVRYVNDAGERDLWIRQVILADAALRPEQATYLRDGRQSIPGRSRMSWAGELRFAP